jgi:murein DD-endopeptidase MepM/ murein hydrolase activator NlpD
MKHGTVDISIRVRIKRTKRRPNHRDEEMRKYFFLFAGLLVLSGCVSVNRLVKLETPRGGVSDQGFVRPCSGVVTSPFGLRTLSGVTQAHKGVDFQGNTLATPVFAAKEGKVTIRAKDDSYGRWIEISHPGGWATRYAHLSVVLVKRGKAVKRGDLIGRVGKSGRAQGGHLHFEVFLNGKSVDPQAVLPFGR